jgi:hypothetical protein
MPEDHLGGRVGERYDETASVIPCSSSASGPDGSRYRSPQDEQAACFANAAAHLRSGGCFVVEVEIPRRHDAS